MNSKNTLTGIPAQLMNEFLAINDLQHTEDVLFQISIHAMDEEVDPPVLAPTQQAHLLRLLKLISALKVNC